MFMIFLSVTLCFLLCPLHLIRQHKYYIIKEKSVAQLGPFFNTFGQGKPHKHNRPWRNGRQNYFGLRRDVTIQLLFKKSFYQRCTYFASTFATPSLHLTPAELLRSSALVLSRDRALNLSAKSFSKLYLAFLFNLKKNSQNLSA